MEQKEQATITLDDKNYIVDDLSDTAKYCLAQVQDLKQQIQAAKSRVDQLLMSEQGFVNALRDEINKAEAPKEGEVA